MPGVLAALEQERTREAARFLAGRLALARAEAVSSGVHVGLRFDADGAFRQYADGNDNGLRIRDIDAGVDLPLGPPIRLEERFAGIAIGVSAGDGSPRDPVRFGRSDLVSFAPAGTATPGSVYVRGGDQSQYVVRVLGATGRIAVLAWSERTGGWAPVP